MRTTKLTLINPLGMHARAASKLVDVSKAFASDITLDKDGKAVDGKSIMALLMLGAAVDSELTLTVNGEDEDAAFTAVCDLVNAGFHELEE
ncbi:MAG: HPr family phosphocarrier protein [Pseudomonadota bacterium]